MHWNATFRYRKAATTTRNADGFLTETNAGEYVVGSICQAERSAPAQHKIGTDGQQFDYSYTIYIMPKYGAVLAVGDTIEIRLNDGTTFEKTILGTDITDRKILAVWV